MKHLILCISGFSGVGKDEFLSRLVKNHGVIQTGLVDPAKRHMADIYGFTEEQLFGPSKFRNSGDLRFPKTSNPKNFRVSHDLPPEPNQWSASPVPWWKYEQGDHDLDTVFVRQHDPQYWLSPREALQRYCELMNLMYQDTWVRTGLLIQKQIASGRFAYNRMNGLVRIDPTNPKYVITAFADFRHHHEFRAAEAARTEDCTPIFIRIKSKRVPVPPFNHRSETEQVTISDSKFDYVIQNDGTVADLHNQADELIQKILRKAGL